MADLRRRRRRPDRRRAGRPDRRARARHAAPRLRPHRHRRPPACSCSTAATQVLPTLPQRLGLRAQRDLQRLGVSVQLHALVTGVDATGVQLDGGADRGAHRRLGRRRARVAARVGAAATDARQRRARARRARPHAARPPRGARRRRPRAACPACPASPRPRCRWASTRRPSIRARLDGTPAAAALPLPRPRRARDHRPQRRRRQDQGRARHGPPRVADLARRAPGLPRRLPQPRAGAPALGLELRHPRPRDAVDHRSPRRRRRAD